MMINPKCYHAIICVIYSANLAVSIFETYNNKEYKFK